ncbi:hypothetical protein O163_13340 [Caldanaerobacter subterraneus subsp. yonseiensis KB-1]|uniref:Nuclease SbcCD subunit C n=1 Tax=Caldanaerobacter subterraneus subsp. yonseiensis KB-1 TaxID=1388761 RepID=U5CLP5_CALSX|nr:AAA family ATPase [Caldanaerobacter subterraneus]ERM90913.1 hypothetical protein O163_13340 [Caldanaerobacter subterraneus subsp. yonseiensis KB-1]
MIKRIKEIVGIGPFENFKNGGSFQFEPLTLIFGLNTYGKSTIADVFRSIEDNNIEVLEKRKTIGATSQSIKVHYTIDNPPTEQSLSFAQQKWSDIDNFPFKIKVFDTKFVDKNIFTGLTITRGNTEKLTEFILGEEGVRLASEIEKLRKDRRELSNNIYNLQQEILKEIEPYGIALDAFIKKKAMISEKNKIEQEIENLKEEIRKKEQNIKNINLILNLQKPESINLEINFTMLFNQFNRLLTRNFEDLNQEILEKISQHINSVFKEKDNKEEEWIKNGFSYIHGDENWLCPFCGQPLNQSKVFKLYKKYFSEGYKNFYKEIENNLANIIRNIKTQRSLLNKNILEIDKPWQKIEEAKKFIHEKEFENESERIKEHINELRNKIKEYQTILDELESKVEYKKEEKLQFPYKALREIELSNLIELEQQIKELIKIINVNIENISKHIATLKMIYQKTSKPKGEIEELKNKQKNYEIDLLRIKLEEKVSSLNQAIEKFDILDKDIKSKEEELQNSQEFFINNYFEKVNDLFVSLGSNNFQIDKKIERRGNKNTIKLEIKCHNQPVNYEDIEFVFSDSDRRALALSIFLAKLETLNENELKNTIIVLDDPVTSFDDNRITNTILKIKELSNKTRQIIILSHYENFFKKMLLSLDNNYYALFKIQKANNTSGFERIEANNFLLDEHEKLFAKIKKFIDGELTQDISKDLRVFLENEIKIRYRLFIYTHNLQHLCLRDLIDKLYEKGYFNNDVKTKLHDFRELLNPNHHKYIGNSNPEDIRNFAKSLMKYVYEEL